MTTRRRWYHPIWTHLPALAVLAWAGWALGRAWPLPLTGPVHFGAGGAADRTGSPLGVVIMLLAMSVTFLLISIGIDEAWARQETRKRYNWLALFDEFTVSFLAGSLVWYLPLLRQPAAAQDFPLGPSLLIAGMAVGLAALLEWLRPWTPREVATEADSADDLRATLEARRAAGGRWVYWEGQNTWWMNLVVLVAGGYLVFGAVIAWTVSPVVTLSNLLPLLILLPLYGGFRVTVTAERTELRWGILGIRLLRVPTAEIADAVVHDFSPLPDFGGVGIRVGRRGTVAFFLRGGRGVLLTTTRGRTFLLGSDTPERLLAAIQFARDGA